MLASLAYTTFVVVVFAALLLLAMPLSVLVGSYLTALLFHVAAFVDGGAEGVRKYRSEYHPKKNKSTSLKTITK